MKNSRTINLRAAVTSVIILPLTLMFPSASMAAPLDTNNLNQLEIPKFASELPLLEVEKVSVTAPVVTAPANISITFSSPAVSSKPSQATLDKIALDKAIVEAEKKAKEDAIAEKKAAEDREKEINRLYAAGEISSIEVEGFKANSTEAITPTGNKLVDIAATGIGNPYVWGGTSPSGWDCSGYVQWVYAKAGISIPRVNQWTAGTITTNPVPGDIVVQNNNTHVGIYIGGGMMYSALNPSQGTLMHPVDIMPAYFIHVDR